MNYAAILAIFLVVMKKGFGQEVTPERVRPLVCNPKSFSLQIPDVIFYDKPAKIQIFNNKEEECSKSPLYTWTVYQLNTQLVPKKKTYIKVDNVMDFEGPSDQTENNMLLSRSDPRISHYLFQFQMSVKLIPEAGWNPWHRNKTFRVNPYNLTLKIFGGGVHDYLLGSGGLTFDASQSYDESFRDNGTENIGQCQKVWNLDPDLPIPKPDQLIWTIPDTYLQNVPKLTATLDIERKNTPFFPQKKRTKQLVYIDRPPPPVLSLVCLENCDPSDAFKDTTLQMKCLENCVDSPRSWKFSPHNQTIADTLFVKEPEDHVTFLSRAFRPGDEIKVEVMVQDTVASLLLTFRVPEPVLKLVCVENCEYDPRADTIIQLTCEDDCENLEITWDNGRADMNEWLSPDQMTVKIRGNLFKDEENLVLTAKSHNKFEVLTINFHEEVPELELSCMILNAPNGTDCKLYPPDPRDSIALTVECLNRCKFLEYKWTLVPEPPNFVMEENLTPPMQDGLTLVPDLYQDEQKVTITVASGKALVGFNTTFHMKIPKLEIKCLQNCEASSTQEDTQFEPVCVENCVHIDYVWSVNNHSPEKVKKWVDDRKLLSIPFGNLIDGKNTFTLTSGKGSTTLIKNFTEPVPELNISCEANCGEPNPDKETVLKIICKSTPHICKAQYEWSITPLADTFSWNDRTTISQDKTILVIKPMTFNDSETIEFKITDGKKGEAKLSLTYKEPVPVLQIICEKNCDPSHPGYPTELHVKCDAHCLPNYDWAFNPESAKALKAIETYGDHIIIGGGAYTDGSTVDVKLTSGKASATYNMKFKIQPPRLQLKCVPPCELPHNPKDVLVINVTCTEYCVKSTYYSWLVEPAREIVYDPKKVIVQKNNDSMVMLPDAFSSGDVVTVTATVEPGSAVNVTLNFFEAQPDLAIECVRNCWEANPLDETVLQAVCKDYCKNIDFYTWDLEPIMVNKSQMVLGPKNATILLKSETYEDKQTVAVTLKARNGKKTQQLKFLQLRPVLTLKCIANCDPSNPFEDVILEANCIEHCFEIQYEWDQIEPVSDKWDLKVNARLTRRNTTLTIIKDFFENGDVHRFYVKSGNGSASIIVRFAAAPAQLQLVCVENCQNSDPLNDTVIQAMCLNYCYDDYQWLLIPTLATFTPPAVNGPNSTLIIPKGTYLDQGSVRVKILTNHSEEFIDIYFNEPIPVLNLTCVSCVKGTLNPITEAIFNVTCTANCFHLDYTWRFSPDSENIKYGSDNVTVIVPGNTYEDEQKVLVTVNSRKGKAETMVTYAVPPGYITIECANNNCPYANPLKPTVFRIKCFNDCEKQEWAWDIQPRDSNFDWTNNIQTDDLNETLTIRPEAYPDGTVVQLFAWSEKTKTLMNQTVVEFREPTSNISIVCVNNCGPYNPLQDLQLSAKCFANCEQLEWKWTVEPASPNSELGDTTTNALSIKSGSYFNNDIIKITLVTRKAKTELLVPFMPFGWDGQCDFEPKTGGISGVTLFAVSCNNFHDDATYRIYESYSGMEDDEMGVLLTYGDSKFLNLVRLSQGNATVLTVAVGNGFETKKEIPLKIKEVLKYPNPGTISAKVFTMALDDNPGNSPYPHQMVQMASLFWTAGWRAKINGGIHNHIIAGITKLADVIEPTQQQSLYMKFIRLSPPMNMLMIRLLMEGILASTSYMKTAKHDKIYTNDQILEEYCNNLLEMISILIMKAFDLNELENQPKTLPSYDYPAPIDFVPERVNYRRHLRKFTHDLLVTTEILPSILPTYQLSSTIIRQSCGQIPTEIMKKPVNLTTAGCESFITTSPRIVHVLEANDLTFSYTFGYFKKNPFWWQDVGINTDLIQFSVNILPVSVTVNLSHKLGEIAGRLSGKVENTLLYELRVEPRSTFSATFTKTDNNYQITIYPKMETRLIKANETVNVNTAGEKFIYVKFESTGGKTANFFMSYKMLECFSWPVDNLAPNKDHCRPLDADANFLTCECRLLSYFGGKISVPEISNQTTQTIWAERYSVNYFFFILIAVFAIFTLLTFLAYLQDKDDVNRVVFLQDNQPGDKELYLINVATGLTTGTTSDIAIQVTGTEGKSRVHILKGDNIKPLQQRNTEHFFAMYTKTFLGDLTTVRLWSNLKGDNPNWYCERVLIEYFPTRQKYLFRVEKNFALLANNCVAHGTFPVTDNTKLTFGQNLREALRETSHFLTPFTQRRRGVSKEAVVVGYAACSAAMLVAFCFTKYLPGMSIVTTAAISSLIALFVGIFLNHLFRNSP